MGLINSEGGNAKRVFAVADFSPAKQLALQGK